MSLQHRKDSVRELRLKQQGITPPKDWNNVEQVRDVVKQQIGAACSAAIYAGVEVGGARYSLTEHDQTELMAHVFYHRTYCNHVNAWIARAGLDELAEIEYGAELPADLAASMARIMQEAGGAV